MTTATDVMLYGWRIRSEVPLPGRRVAGGGRPDVRVTVGVPRHVPAQPPSGEPVAELAAGAMRWYSVAMDGDGWLLRFHGAADVHVSRAGDIRCHLDPRGDRGVLPILIAGTTLAFLQAVRGGLVLHASAVEMGGHATAIAGSSGMGKSTVAALLCSAGARLVTDDVLVVDPDDATCRPGATALRLRTGAQGLVDLFDPSPPTLPTADGRIAVAPPSTALDVVPLRTIVVPRPVPETAAVRVTSLGPADRIITLARFPRIIRWFADEPRRCFLEGIATLASTVPVVEVSIPWGTQALGADLAERLLEAFDGVHLAPAGA